VVWWRAPAAVVADEPNQTEPNQTKPKVVSFHVFPRVVIVVERLEAAVTLVKLIDVGSHMVQQPETSVELLVTMRAFEPVFLNVCLDVPLQGLNLGELFLTKFTVKGLDGSLFFLVDFLALGQFQAV
jgi:hypothetical protein